MGFEPKNTAFYLMLAIACLPALSTARGASDPVGVVVLRENGVGSGVRAQGHLDRLLAVAARANGWTAFYGKYLTRRDRALAFIDEERPHFGILSLGAYLALRESHRLGVIGQVSLSAGGGRRYYLVGKGSGGLDGCKGQLLASNHLQDRRFIESVVADGAFAIADFKKLVTRRPIQTLKKVIRGEARCALIDDAQWSAASKVEGGNALRVRWKSGELPPMPVVAFPVAGERLKVAFRKSLSGLCEAGGKSACRNVGIVSLTSATENQYAKIVAAYSK
jgi:hypothetical protein